MASNVSVKVPLLVWTKKHIETSSGFMFVFILQSQARAVPIFIVQFLSLCTIITGED